jgi:hypothetical protein
MRDCSCKKSGTDISIQGAYCAFGPRERQRASVEIIDGHITRIAQKDDVTLEEAAGVIDLTDYLLMPGLINAHDHLQFALHPRMADPPYRNYVEWGEDIHSKFSDVIMLHRSVPKAVRLWWGGLRNLLCGVTTVCHHDKLWPELERADFPVKVVRRYGWGHSVALGGNLHHAQALTPMGGAFIVHACEGVDDLARAELFQLDQLGLLTSDTVLVHGLAVDESGIALMQKRGVSLIVCPSSNEYLFGALPSADILIGIDDVALGNDSPLTAVGDLLNEVHFALRSLRLTPDEAYRMVTKAPATILRLPAGSGAICKNAPGDIIAVRDTGHYAADRLQALSMEDIEFVMIDGCVQLSSQAVWKRLPAHIRDGLEPLYVNGILRWLRAPVEKLLRQAEDVLGCGMVRLSGRQIELPITGN